jgi:TonB family protein
MWPAHSAENASLDLSLIAEPRGATSHPEAWKKIIGDKPVTTRLQTLPEPNPRWSALLASTIFQVLLTGLLIVLPALFPDKLASSKSYEVVPVAAPETEIALPTEQPLVHPNITPTPPPPPLSAGEPLQPPSAAKLIAPKALLPPKPKPAPVATVDVPALYEISAEAKFEAPLSEPAKPREPVETGTLAAGGAAAPATTDQPVARVQTGGFGDPNGVPGDTHPTVRANIAPAGSPALLPGPGFGNGTGSAKGVRGTVASSGFGDGVTISPASNGEGTREPVKAGGFGTAVADPDAPKPKQAETPHPVQPVVILSKPNPAYTDEARKLRLEGDVSVDVVFLASGSVQVVRVANGLGHGLDETAVRAAEQIRFKPALQDGKPVDFPATVHIEFQLAF